MISARLILDDLAEVATLAHGSVPRRGRAMGDLGLVRNATIAIDGGRIVYVGPSEVARRRVRLRPGGARRSLAGFVAVPGFVDAHTHVLFAGDRSREVGLKVRGASYLDIARAGGGLFSTVRATRVASSEVLLEGAAVRLARVLRNGTTTVEVKSGYALEPAGELRLLSLVPELARRTGLKLVPTFLGAHAVPPEYARRSDAYVDLVVRSMIPEVARRGLARFCDVFCEPGFFSVRQAKRILRAGTDSGLRPKVHADEFRTSGGARLAAELGACSADHLLRTPPKDYRRLARSGTIAVLLPVTPFASLDATDGPGRGLVDARVPVALGSDLCPNSWVESMPTVISHAVYASRLTPAEAVTAATVNAAAAVGAENVAGMIAPGRPADVVVFDLPNVEQLGYRIGAIPTDVYRQGIRVSSR
jgi:imidazolonepropionase